MGIRDGLVDWRTFGRAVLLLQVMLFAVHLFALAYIAKQEFDLSGHGRFLASIAFVIGVLLAPYVIAMFVPLIVLSIPLYVLCARTLHEHRRNHAVVIVLASVILVSMFAATEYAYHFSGGGFFAVKDVVSGLDTAGRRVDSRMISIATCAAILLSPVLVRGALGVLRIRAARNVS
jgi:hypothetical protein